MSQHAAETELLQGGVFAVVVIYRMQPTACQSLQTLLAAVAALPPGALRLRILVADNTPGGQAIEALPPGVEYRAYPENPGLARPYNDALALAEGDGYMWMLTLDQDTSLPVSFLLSMAMAAAQYAAAPQVAAVVPRIVDRGRPVSPFRYRAGFLPIVPANPASGISGPHTSALNSGSLLRVQALRSVDGYDERFPLHNSDTRLYQRLHVAGLRVAVAAEVTVPHELSILDREHRMSPDRYRHMLEDECAFWDRHMGTLGRAERLVRLVGRWCKGMLHNEDAAFQRVTLGEIRRRLATSRVRRAKTRGAGPSR